MLCRPVNELMVAADDAIQDEEVNAMRVELTPQTKQTVVLRKKKLWPLQQDKEMGTGEPKMNVALVKMPMAVVEDDSLGHWLLSYAP